MRKALREQIRKTFGGLCAYTGKPLGEDWQVDHINSKYKSEQVLVYDTHYKHKDTGEILTREEISNLISKDRSILYDYNYFPKKTKPVKEVDNIENLYPCCRIVNHYKRALDLEGFRRYMLSFHTRLAKLPKSTSVESTKRRIVYMNTIADLFDITVDKPFSGVFYFERI